MIQPEEVDAFLLPLQVGRLPGVGKVNEEKLAKLGIGTVGELQSLERAQLESEFGRTACAFTNLRKVSTRIQSYRTSLRSLYRSKTRFRKIFC